MTSHTSSAGKGLGLSAVLLCAGLVFLFCLIDTAYGRNFRGFRTPKWFFTTSSAGPGGTINRDEASGLSEGASLREIMSAPQASDVPKLFWFECGPRGDCANAFLLY